MSDLVLVVLDITGIQPYIFGSNRLRENVGASHLVHLATTGWLLDDPNSFLPSRHNIVNGEIHPGAARIENGDLDAELVYAGGGNTVLLFRSMDDAVEFKQRLSRQALEQAPGIGLVSETVECRWEDSLAAAMDQAMQGLATRKQQAIGDRPLLGLGVSAACRSTGMVANTLRHTPGSPSELIPVSSEVAAKWDQVEGAKARLEAAMLVDVENEFAFPDQFEHLGRSVEDFSYIAVVHADGNHMGKKLQRITEHFKAASSDENRAYLIALRDFSEAANSAGSNALKAVVQFVADVNRQKIIEPATVDGKQALSMRPIVFGGDDVTFVCDGRIGLQCAVKYLEAFARHQVPDATGNMGPCVAAAGIAIVKVRYPFARAYELSTELCKSAKNASGRAYPAIDWHLTQSGLFGSLREIRQAEYDEEWDGDTLKRSLLMRPLALERTQPEDWHSWQDFVALLAAFKNREAWPRNKTMQLRETLREGSVAVGSFVTNYQRELPDIGIRGTGYRRTGWAGSYCVYFDAIEMIEQEVVS